MQFNSNDEAFLGRVVTEVIEVGKLVERNVLLGSCGVARLPAIPPTNREDPLGSEVVRGAPQTADVLSVLRMEDPDSEVPAHAGLWLPYRRRFMVLG